MRRNEVFRNIWSVASASMGPAVLAGDFIGESIKFVIYLAVIVCAFTAGAKLRKHVDAKKASK